MIQEPSMSVEKTHSMGAVLKGAFLLFFLVFGVATYAQSYNSQVSYRVNSATPTSVSAQQWNGYDALNGAYRVADDCRQEGVVGYKSFQSTVFEPFDNTPPSGVNSRRRSNGVNLDDWGDPDIADPNESEEYPLGEPWILLLFAAVAAFFIARRKRQVA